MGFLAKELNICNRHHFGFVPGKIQMLKNKITFLQAHPNEPYQIEKKKHICALLEEQFQRYDSIFKQKSRELWIKDGDRNYKFFHASIMVCRRNDFIPSITLDYGLKIWDREKIGRELKDQFKLIFSINNPIIIC